MTTSGAPERSAASAPSTLGTMPPAITPSVISCSARSSSSSGSRRPRLVEHAVGVGQQHQPGGHRAGQAGGHLVGVDVADQPVLVERQRRDDRQQAGSEQRVQQRRPLAPLTLATRPRSGKRSAASRPPSMPVSPTARHAGRAARPPARR
jgi:hypothetical protein